MVPVYQKGEKETLQIVKPGELKIKKGSLEPFLFYREVGLVASAKAVAKGNLYSLIIGIYVFSAFI